MSSVDDRIVKMQFDNAQFTKGAKDAQKVLSDFDKSLANAGKNNGLDQIDSKMGRIQVTASNMATVVTTALATITNKAVNVGMQLADSLTMAPVRDGFREYESLLTKQNTIMNATGKSSGKVKSVLNELNKYSDQTIYSFGDMTDSITKFVNAGVPLDQSVKSIKGIANAAAFAGADTNEASRAMYAFSQSMGAGYVMLQDWNQIENANMGTVKFKKQLLEAGVAAGTLTKRGKEYIMSNGKAVTATKGWRDSLQEQWATTEVLNGALSKYSDTSTKFGKKAQDAATKVRTWSMFMDTLKESIGSGWASVFGNLIGGLKPATKMWTGLSNAVSGVVTQFFDVVATAAKVWRQMDGAKNTIQGFKNILSPFVAIWKLLTSVMAAAFPSAGKNNLGNKLAGISKGFELVTRPLKMFANLITWATPGIVKVVSVIQKAVSGPLAAAKNILGALGKVVKTFFGMFDGGSFVQVGNAFRDFVASLGLAAPNMEKVYGFFARIKSGALSAVDVLKSFGDGIKSIATILGKGQFDGKLFGFEEDSKFVDFLFNVRERIASIVDYIKGLGGKIKFPEISMPSFGSISMPSIGGDGGASAMADNASSASDKIQAVWAKIKEIVGNATEFIGGKLEKIDFEDVLAGFNLGIWATIGVQIAKVIGAVQGVIKGFKKVGPKVADILDGVGGALKGFQTQAKADLIRSIGIAIGILAASLFLLAQLNTGQIILGLTGLAGVMGMMTVSLVILSKMTATLEKEGASARLTRLAAVMILVASALLIMSTALRVLGAVNLGDILKGVGTLGMLLLTLAALGQMAEKNAAQMVKAATALTIIGAALGIVATSLLLFKMVDWESMGKAGASLGGLTVALIALGNVPYDQLVKAGAALLIASVGIGALGVALLVFKMVDWDSMVKAGAGLAGLTVGLALISIMPASNLLAAAGAMVLISVALQQLALAGIMISAVSWESLGKLGAALLGLVVVVAALLFVMQSMAAGVIMFGIFAVSMGLLAVAALGLTVALTTFIALGAAAGVALIAFASAAAFAITSFLQTLALQAPIIKDSLLQMLQTLIDGIVESVPMIIDGVKRLWTELTGELQGKDNIQEFATAAAAAITSFLKGLASKAKDLAAAAVELIVALVDGIAEKADDLVVAAAGLIVALIEGLSEGIGDIVDAAGDLVVEFINGLEEENTDIVNAGGDLIVSLIEGIGENMTDIVHAAGDAIVNFLNGLETEIPRVAAAGSSLIGTFIRSIGENAAALAQTAFEVIINFVNDLANTIRTEGPRLREAAWNLADAIVDGMVDGIKEAGARALNTVKDWAQSLIDKAKSILKIFSPSKVFYGIGEYIVEGLTNGISDNAAAAINAVASMVSGQIAVAEEYVSKFVQKLEQQAITARGLVEGLTNKADATEETAKKRQAAQEAAADKLDDDAKKKREKAKKKGTSKAEKKRLEEDAKALEKQADKLRNRAKKQYDEDVREDKKAIERAKTAADEKTKIAEEAAEKANRAREFQQADSLTKAQMKSEDAQTYFEKANESKEVQAAKASEAKALRKEANEREKDLKAELKKNGKLYSKEQKQKMWAEIDTIRRIADTRDDEARAAGLKASDYLDQSKAAAAEALMWQEQAGQEAAIAFANQYDWERKSAQAQAEFDAKTDSEKAAIRRADAARLQAEADAELKQAQALAFKDLEGANALAESALNKAQAARDAAQEAADYEKSAAEEAAGGGVGGSNVPPRTIDISAAEAATAAYNAIADRANAAEVAAAGSPSIEFRQYNTSPEALNPAEVYRQTNNLLNAAGNSLARTA